MEAIGSYGRATRHRAPYSPNCRRLSLVSRAQSSCQGRRRSCHWLVSLADGRRRPQAGEGAICGGKKDNWGGGGGGTPGRKTWKGLFGPFVGPPPGGVWGGAPPIPPGAAPGAGA